MKELICSAVCFSCTMIFVPNASSQTAPIVDCFVPHHVASGNQVNRSMKTKTVFAHLVRMNDASSLQIQFGRTTLPQGTMIRMTSLQDGAMQHHTHNTLEQWRHKSAWFNGSTILVELVAEPNTASSHFTIDGVIIIEQLGEDRSICGNTDDRELSYEARDARAMPIGCTAWIIDDVNHCLLTAGHCADSSGDISVIEFNVPISDSNGNIQHPGPEDQYASDPESLQWDLTTIGNDWAYFGCFENTETGLTPFEAQDDFYVLSDAAPAVNGQQITITGFGTTSSQVPAEYNQAQKTHTGPYFALDGTSISYQTDTSGGNSGSAVLNEDTGEAIGIHTNAGCSDSSGNWGCAIHNAGLQNALANPQGVCIPNILHFDFPDGLPFDVLPNTTTTVHFALTAGEEEPIPDQVGVVLNVNGNQVVLNVEYQGDDQYVVTFPSFQCDDVIDYYFKALSDKGTYVYSPFGGPTDRYDIVVGTIVQEIIMSESFVDGIPSGWTTSGLWTTASSCLPNGECDGGAAAYFGLTSNCNFDNGSTVEGGLITPVISLDGYIGDLILSFCSAIQTEGLDSYDLTDLYINGSYYASFDESNDWEQIEVALTGFTGETIQFEWRFDSVDSLYNDYRGWHIDGIQLIAQSLECDDTISCPEDINGDGLVNVPDILMVIDQWELTDSPADVNGDGIVNVTDILAIIANWGPCL